MSRNLSNLRIADTYSYLLQKSETTNQIYYGDGTAITTFAIGGTDGTYRLYVDGGSSTTSIAHFTADTTAIVQVQGGNYIVGNASKLSIGRNDSDHANNLAITDGLATIPAISASGTVHAAQFFSTTHGQYFNTTASLSSWASASGKIYREADNVGIGTNAPTHKLDLTGTMRISGSEYSGSGRTHADRVGLWMSGSIIPDTPEGVMTGSYDIGSEERPFRDLYLYSGSLRIVTDGKAEAFTGKDLANLKAGRLPERPGKPGQMEAGTITGLNGGTTSDGNTFIQVGFHEDRIKINAGGVTFFDADEPTHFKLGDSSNTTHTEVVSHLSASRDLWVSGSGDVVGNLLVRGILTTNGNTTVPRINIGDSNNYIAEIVSDQLRITAGGQHLIEVVEGATNFMGTRAGFRLGIGTGTHTGVVTPGEALEVVGNISASGNIYMDETAGTDNSVVVLSDGKLVVDEIDPRVWGNTLLDDTDATSYLQNSDTGSMGNLVVDGTISASNNIKISKTRRFDLTDNGASGAYLSSIGVKDNLYIQTPMDAQSFIVSKDFFFKTGSDYPFSIRGGGRKAVGINVPLGSQTREGLSVSGSIWASTDIIADDQIRSDNYATNAGTTRLQLGSTSIFSGNVSSSGTITANSFVGDGSTLTGVTADWDGLHVGTAGISGSLNLSGSLHIRPGEVQVGHRLHNRSGVLYWGNINLSDTGSGIVNVEADTSPKLGGDLDANNKNITSVATASIGRINATDSYSYFNKIYITGSNARIDGLGTANLYNFDTIKAEKYSTANDSNTYIAFNYPDQISFVAGNRTMLVLSEATSDRVIVGDGSDIDFQVKTDNSDWTLWIDGGTDKVGIGTNNPSKKLHVDGDAKTANLYINTSSIYGGSGDTERLSFANDISHFIGTISQSGGYGTQIIAPKISSSGTIHAYDYFETNYGTMGTYNDVVYFGLARNNEWRDSSKYNIKINGDSQKGRLFLNAHSGQNIQFRVNNTQEAVIDSDGLYLYGTRLRAENSIISASQYTGSGLYVTEDVNIPNGKLNFSINDNWDSQTGLLNATKINTGEITASNGISGSYGYMSRNATYFTALSNQTSAGEGGYSLINSTQNKMSVKIGGNYQHFGLYDGFAHADVDKFVVGKSPAHALTAKNIFNLAHDGTDGNDGLNIVRYDSSVIKGDYLGGIGFNSSDGNVPSSILESSAYIAAYASTFHSVSNKGGYLEFGLSKMYDDDDTQSHSWMKMDEHGLSFSGSLNVKSGSATFANIPTSDSGLSTGDLYTQLGSELGLGGITGSIATKKFLFVK